MTNLSRNPTLDEIAGLVRGAGELYGPDASRLARLVAQGRPVPEAQVAALFDELGIDRATAAERLPALAERDQRGEVIGAVPGVTVRPTPHRFTTDAAQVWTWCAPDTLVLPVMLGQEARVASQSPGSKEIVRFTVTPDGVSDVEPEGAVVSFPALVGGRGGDELHLAVDVAKVTAVEQIWQAFCHHAHAFASLQEAREWFAGRDDVEFIPLREAFAVVRGIADGLLAHE
jgi:alkylmercury lyase